MKLDDEDLSALIRQHATRHAAPAALRAAVRTQIALAEAGRSDTASPVQGPRWPGFNFNRRTAVAGFAAGVLCATLVLLVVPRIDLDSPLEADLVAAHVRALQAGHLADVASSDRHTVKPWFQGKLDYAPPVFDLAADGFPLVGGRIEHVRGDSVATLAYAHNRHSVDVFIWPAVAQQPPARLLRKGFNVLSWADGSMQYWLVSDLDRIEMERFAKLWAARAAAQ